MQPSLTDSSIPAEITADAIGFPRSTDIASSNTNSSIHYLFPQ
jgi:hypothetical protein